MSRNSGDLTPAEAAHFVTETLLEVVVGALLVTGVATVMVALATREWPVGLLVAAVVLAVATGVLWNRTSNLVELIETARRRQARLQDD